MSIYQFEFRVTPESHSDATMFTRKGIAYTPKEKKDYQNRCLANFVDLGKHRSNYQLPIDGPLIAIWLFYMPRPAYLAKVKPTENLPHHTKPDGDGLVKVVQDLIQTGKVSHKAKSSRPRLGLITNDSQITLTCIEKFYVSNKQTPKIKLVLCQTKQASPILQSVLKHLLASEKSAL